MKIAAYGVFIISLIVAGIAYQRDIGKKKVVNNHQGFEATTEIHEDF